MPAPGFSQSPKTRVERIPEPNRAPSLEDIERLAHWMDSLIQIPGLKFRFGLDSLIGLFPGVGDTVTSLVSIYILRAAQQHGVSRLMMCRMAGNIAIDYVIGSVPFLGDAFDFVWKSNEKNIALLREHIAAPPLLPHRTRKSDWLFLAMLAGLLLVLLVGSVTIAWWTAAKMYRLIFSH